MLEREYEIHFNTYKQDFPVSKFPIGITLHNSSHYNLLTLNKKQKIRIKKNPLNTLTNYACIGISNFKQILTPITQLILSPEEFKNKYKATLKFIKEALQQATTSFSQNPPEDHPSLLHYPYNHNPPITATKSMECT